MPRTPPMTSFGLDTEADCKAQIPMWVFKLLTPNAEGAESSSREQLEQPKLGFTFTIYSGDGDTFLFKLVTTVED